MDDNVFKKLEKLIRPYIFGLRDQQLRTNDLLEQVIKSYMVDPAEMRVRLESVKTLNFIANKGDKGDTPVKGIDYFTDEETQAFMEQVTPIKGKDYLTSDEVKEIIKQVTPVKNRDYFDGKPGMNAKPPVKGKDYFTASEIKRFIKLVTPTKGKHYFTDKEIAGIRKDVAEDVISELGKPYDPIKVRNALESLQGASRLKMSAINGLDAAISQAGSSNKGGFPSSGGGGAVASFVAYVDVPTGEIDGVNTTYGTSRSIQGILSLAVDNAFIHPKDGAGNANFTFTPGASQFVMTSPLDISLANTGFTVVYY